jgi:hypothetical protein
MKNTATLGFQACSYLASASFPQKSSNGIPDLTDLFIRWKKFLTAETRTPNMADAPASAFPPIVVPLIRMPE